MQKWTNQGIAKKRRNELQEHGPAAMTEFREVCSLMGLTQAGAAGGFLQVLRTDEERTCHRRGDFLKISALLASSIRLDIA